MTHDHFFAALTDTAQTEVDTPRIANVSRRGMLAGLGGLVVALSLTGCNHAEAAGFGADGMPNGWRDDPKLFVAIADDGVVTITCQRSDMGQGIRTGWGIIIGDELEADWTRSASSRPTVMRASTATRTPTARARPARTWSTCATPARPPD